MIQHPQYKTKAIISISSELIAMGLLEDAMGAVHQAREAVNGVPFLWFQSKALFKISRQLQAIGKVAQAAEVAQSVRVCMEEAEDQAKAIPDESLYKSFFFREICRQWVAMGEIDRALAIANAVPHAWVRSEAFLAIPFNNTIKRFLG